MQYVTPFDVIKRELNLLAMQGTVRINITYDEFLSIVKRLIEAIDVQEDWYLTTYPDVAEGIGAGVQRAAKEHFVQHGYFEGRLPYQIPVDETWYLRNYPDVAEGIDKGEHLSAQDHFLRAGYAEGRRPFPPSSVPTKPMPKLPRKEALSMSRGGLRR
jgi:hypothetical protein